MGGTPDFFRSRLEQMIDMRHPLAVLATRIDWKTLKTRLAPLVAHKNRKGKKTTESDLFGTHESLEGSGVSPAGRPRLPLRLMASLLYLKHAYNLSDEALVERWSENNYFQFFSGLEYFEPRLPCDATQIGRFRRILGEEGVEQLLKLSIETAVQIGAIDTEALKHVIVDSTVQEKAIAHPTDSRLLEVARKKLVEMAKKMGIKLKQTYLKESKNLCFRAGGYAHAKQFKRMRKVINRQRTVLGRLMREIERKSLIFSLTVQEQIKETLQHAQRIRDQKRNSKNKLYAWHAPEVECICKGKARKPYEFGVKVSLAITTEHNLIVGSRSFAGTPSTPYDGHTLPAQLEQSNILLEDIEGFEGIENVLVDLGYRGVDVAKACSPAQVIHRGKYKSLSKKQRQWLKRRQAIEPCIGHAKHDHRMKTCHLKGSEGDALHAVLCASGYNIKWLLRAIVSGGICWRWNLWRLQGIFKRWGCGCSGGFVYG